MTNNYLRVLIGVIYIFCCNQSASSQDLDTPKVISKIREQFSMITNGKVDNKTLKVKELGAIDESPMFENLGIKGQLLYSYNENGIFLIRHYNTADEGGIFWIQVREIYLWKGKPFFYYEKSFLGNGVTKGEWNETRLYINNEVVVRKLIKETRADWGEATKNGFYKSQLNSVPNQKVEISKSDYSKVISFYETIKDDFKLINE